MFAKMGPQFALLMGTLLGFLDTNLTYSSEHPPRIVRMVPNHQARNTDGVQKNLQRCRKNIVIGLRSIRAMR